MTEPLEANAQSGSGVDASGATAQDGTPGAPPEPPASQSAEPMVSREEHEHALARMRASDKRASDREAELRQLRDKDLPEAEKLKRDYEEATAQLEKLKETNRKLALDGAFLKNTKYVWKDGSAALKLADMTGVEIAEDGTVTGLDNALAKLAKEYPWLLADAEPKPAGDGPHPSAQAGAPAMNGAAGSSAPAAGKLQKRFAALAGRVKP